MIDITRKDFLKLSASAAAATAAVGAGIPVSTGAQPYAAPRAARKTLIRNADVLTMDPKLGEMPGMDVLIDGGNIIAIGKNISAADADVIDATGMILMPGMTDGHRHIWEGIEAGHLVKTNPKNYATYQTSKKKIMVCMTAEDHYFAAYLGGLQALDSGVTTVLDYAHIQWSQDRAIASAKGLQDTGIGGWYGYQISHTPTFGPGDTVSMKQAEAEQAAMGDDAHFRTADVLAKEIFSDSSAPLRLGLCMSNGAFGASIDKVKAEMERMRSYGTGMIAGHSHRPNKPFPAGHFGARGSGIADLKDARLLGPDLHLSHGNGLTDDELKMLADSGGMICATAMGEFPYKARGLPGSVHGRARAAGVAVGTGLDVGVALTQDYFENMRCAFWNLYLDPEGAAIAKEYKSADTLDFTTALGAKALRLGDVTGTITIGKRADLVLLRTDRYGFGMMGSLADRVLNFAQLPDVDSVWASGKAVKRNGQMIGVNWATMKARLHAIQERLEAQTATINFI